MCVYFSDPVCLGCSGETGGEGTRLIVVKSVKVKQWFQAKVILENEDSDTGSLILCLAFKLVYCHLIFKSFRMQ